MYDVAEGFDAYKTYLALKRHFTSDYDYFKYNGKVRAGVESFLKRNDKFFFRKLITSYIGLLITAGVGIWSLINYYW